MDFIKKYESSIVFTILILLSYLTWSYNFTFITLCLFAVMFAVNAFYFKKGKYNLLIMLLIPTLFNDIVTTAFMEDFYDMSRYYIYIIPLGILYGIMLEQIIVNRKNLQNKELMIGILIWLLTMIPSFFQTLNMYNSILETLVYLNTLLMAFYVMSSTKIKKQEFYIIVILFVLLGLIQMFDDLFIGNNIEVILDRITRKRISVGWSKQNNLAQYAAFALPMVLYFSSIKKGNCKYLFYFIAFLFVSMIIITSARTTFVSLALIFIPMMVYIYKRRDLKTFKRDVTILVCVGLTVLIIMTFSGVMGAIITRMLDVRLDSTDRVKHWIMSIDHFLDAPLFGTGILTTDQYIYLLPSYHNVFVDALTNTGIVGLFGTLYLFYVVIRQLLSSKHNFIISMSLLTFFVAMSLDTAHINPITLVLMFVSFHFIEVNHTK